MERGGGGEDKGEKYKYEKQEVEEEGKGGRKGEVVTEEGFGLRTAQTGGGGGDSSSWCSSSSSLRNMKECRANIVIDL